MITWSDALIILYSSSQSEISGGTPSTLLVRNTNSQVSPQPTKTEICVFTSPPADSVAHQILRPLASNGNALFLLPSYQVS